MPAVVAVDGITDKVGTPDQVVTVVATVVDITPVEPIPEVEVAAET